MTPGAVMLPLNRGDAAHHGARSEDGSEPFRGASMPFCSVMTVVSGPTIGRIASPAASTSHSLTQNSTRSTAPISAGLAVAFAG